MASTRDLQRYKELLLDKQRELLSVQGDAAARVPAAGGLEGDLIGQANADAEAELHIRLHQTDARLLRAIEEALARIKQGTFGVCQVCKQPVSSLRPVWKRCPGHATAATARSTNSRMVLWREDHESLHRRYSGTWQVARCCYADHEPAWSQDGECVRGDPDVIRRG